MSFTSVTNAVHKIRVKTEKDLESPATAPPLNPVERLVAGTSHAAVRLLGRLVARHSNDATRRHLLSLLVKKFPANSHSPPRCAPQRRSAASFLRDGPPPPTSPRNRQAARSTARVLASSRARCAVRISALRGRSASTRQSGAARRRRSRRRSLPLPRCAERPAMPWTTLPPAQRSAALPVSPRVSSRASASACPTRCRPWASARWPAFSCTQT